MTGGERVKQSGLLTGCEWRNGDGLKRSKVAFQTRKVDGQT